MKRQSPNDLSSSLPRFDEGENNLPTTTGVKEATQRCDNITETTRRNDWRDDQRTQYNNHSSRSDGCDRLKVAAGYNGKVPSLKPTTEWKNVPPDISGEESRRNKKIENILVEKMENDHGEETEDIHREEMEVNQVEEYMKGLMAMS